MERTKKKALIEQYKTMQHPMGVFMIRLKPEHHLLDSNNQAIKKCHIKSANNLRSIMNSTKVKLASNFYPFRELQADWTRYGEAAFEVAILEELPYTKEDLSESYEDELEILRLMWEDKLQQQGYVNYKKSR
jgi:hypothetical protein